MPHSYEGSELPRNLCYLLWCAGHRKAEWGIRLAEMVQLKLERADALLRGAPVVPRELQALAQALGEPEDSLLFNPLWERAPILQENVKYLLGSAAHGEKKVIAERLGVRPNAITSWSSGAATPNPSNLTKLKLAFGIEVEIDLSKHPIFLDPEPIGDNERRNWLIGRIREIDSTRLRLYFPALRKLLNDH